MYAKLLYNIENRLLRLNGGNYDSFIMIHRVSNNKIFKRMIEEKNENEIK